MLFVTEMMGSGTCGTWQNCHMVGEHMHISKFCLNNFIKIVMLFGAPLWSSGQSSWLLTQRSLVRFPALQDFLSSEDK
jgi:hypothetical protein